MRLSTEQASAFATLALRCVQQEYPYAPGHVFNGPEDLKLPRALHPAFYGCFDWHSAVHGHWMLLRLLNRFELPEAEKIRRVLDEHLTAANLQTEADYFCQPHRKNFERTYGWAWVLKLASELGNSKLEEAKVWAHNFKPLESVIVERYLDFLSKDTYPIRTGLHSNSGFGLIFPYDYATSTGNSRLQEAIAKRALSWFGEDSNYPVAFEPSGADFLSPALIEADLMLRIFAPDAFRSWFSKFLPTIETSESLLHPARVVDRSDGQVAHLDGLNLSRAWCFRHIASALSHDDQTGIYLTAAQKHESAGLAGVFSGEYAGEHWLASFATYLLTEAD